MNTRRVVIVLGVLFVGLRVALAWTSPIHLFQGEEYVHLRLLRQLQAGLEVGDLSLYAYGDGRGINGGGSIVLSGLYLVLGPLLGQGELALRTMAILWASAGALLVVLLGRRCHGPLGDVAALGLLLCMPPAYLVHSCIAWGNHAEGGVLILLLLWVLHRESESDGAGKPWLYLSLGFLFVFLPWFWPLALLAVGLAVPVFAVRRCRSPRVLGLVVLGGLCALPPWLTVEFGNEYGLLSFLAPDLGASSGPVLTGIDKALAYLVEVFDAVPVYAVDWAGRWQPPFWLSGVVALVLRCLVWGVVLAVLVRAMPTGREGKEGRPPAAVFVAAALALLLPVVLVAVGAALPRRMTAVYLLWAVVLAGPVRLLLVPGPRQSLRRGLAVVLLFLGLAPSLLLITSGQLLEPRPSLQRYALCPADVPVYESGACVRDLSEAHLPLLSAIDADPRLVDWPLRKMALVGFDAATGGVSTFALRRRLAPCPHWRLRMPDLLYDGLHQQIAWQYLGAALAVSCGEKVAAERCERDAPESSLSFCIEGVVGAPYEAPSVLNPASRPLGLPRP